MVTSATSGAPLEHFLVVLKEDVSAATLQALAGQVQQGGGRVLLVTANGKALIITASHQTADGLRRLPSVQLVGGIQIKQRQIVRQRN